MRKVVGVMCRKSSAERSANYPLSLFRIPQPKNSAFTQITILPFARIGQRICNRCIAAFGIPWSLASVFFFVVRLPKNGSFFVQFRLTSKSLMHSKCHVVISLIDYSLYNRCDSRTDDRTKLIMFNFMQYWEKLLSHDSSCSHTDRRDDRIM